MNNLQNLIDTLNMASTQLLINREYIRARTAKILENKITTIKIIINEDSDKFKTIGIDLNIYHDLTEQVNVWIVNINKLIANINDCNVIKYLNKCKNDLIAL